MSFKNALKNLVTHFSTVWKLLLYIIIFAALILGISLPFVLPIARAFAGAGVFEDIRLAFSSLFGENGWNAMWDGLYAAYQGVGEVLKNDGKVATLIMYFVIFVVIVAFRFFLGLYEIPMATVIDGRMSCNAHYGFGGKFFSTLLLSMRYSLVKMLFTSAFDVVITFAVYGISKGVGTSIALPFLIFLVLLVLGSFRFSLFACWAPCVASGECGIFKGFVRSARLCFKNFGTIYSTYLVSFVLIFSISLLVTLLTFGVGLLIALPFFATYVSYLNMTEYYNKMGRRYYVDGAVFTPPPVNNDDILAAVEEE